MEPPGPPRPPVLFVLPGWPSILIFPAITTSPLANIFKGVFVELRVKVIVTPLGILTVVKLKMPLVGAAID